MTESGPDGASEMSARVDAPQNRSPVVALCAAVAAVVVLVSIATGPAAPTLRRAGLLPGPASVTEAWFSDVARLPRVAAPGQRVSVGLVVANHEGSDRDYRWRAEMVDGPKVTQVASGALQVRHGDAEHLKVTAEMPQTPGRSLFRIVVDGGSANEPVLSIPVCTFEHDGSGCEDVGR